MKLDFDITSSKIEISDKIKEYELINYRGQIPIDLPPSFMDFIKTYTDSLFISSGNALSIFPLCDNKDSFTNIVDISKDYAHLGNVLVSHKLLIFGMSGVDSETWAFYTAKKYSDGEYPILWILPEEERFFVHSSSFESFINIQYKSLTDNDSMMDYDSFYKSLVEKYDKKIEPFGFDTIYYEADDLSGLDKIMSEI